MHQYATFALCSIWLITSLALCISRSRWPSDPGDFTQVQARRLHGPPTQQATSDHVQQAAIVANQGELQARDEFVRQAGWRTATARHAPTRRWLRSIGCASSSSSA